MAIQPLQTVEIIEVMENFLARRRPPEHLRAEIDIDYKIDGQSVIITEVRPRWQQPGLKTEIPVAKATWLKSGDHWKVYWMRGTGKWERYEPKPTIKTLRAFTQLVDEDKYCAFWG